MATRKVAFRKKRYNRIGIIYVTLVVLILLVVLMFKSAELNEKEMAYIQQEEILQAQIDQEMARTEELLEYEKYTKTAKYVEEVAKEKLGLVYADEIIFESEVSQ